MKLYRIRSMKSLNSEIEGAKTNTLRRRVLEAALSCGVNPDGKAQPFKVTAIRSAVNANLPAGTVAPNDQVSDHLSRSVKAGLLKSSQIVRTVQVTESESTA